MNRLKESVSSVLLAVSLLGAASLAAAPAWSANKATSAAAVPADKALTEFAKQWMVSALGRDGKFVNANSIDAPAGSFLVFGTSGEKGHGLQGFVAHLDELKPLTWTEMTADGYVVDDFAWFTGTAQAPLPGGDMAKTRFTLVMRKVDGAWKVTHCHLSEPVPRTGIKKGS